MIFEICAWKHGLRLLTSCDWHARQLPTLCWQKLNFSFKFLNKNCNFRAYMDPNSLKYSSSFMFVAKCVETASKRGWILDERLRNRKTARHYFVCSSTDQDRIFYLNVTGLFEQFIQQDNVIECGRLVMRCFVIESTNVFVFLAKFYKQSWQNISWQWRLLELICVAGCPVWRYKIWNHGIFTVTFSR